MQLEHFARLIVEPFNGLELGADRSSTERKNIKQSVAHRPTPFERNRQPCLLILFVCAVQCLIPHFSTAIAMAQDKTVPDSGAPNRSAVSPETHRPQPQATALISALEPKVFGGSSANRRIAPVPARSPVHAQLSVSRTYKVTPHLVTASNSAAASDRDVQGYGLLSLPRHTSFRDTQADPADGKYVISSGEFTNGARRMVPNGAGGDFRPLMKIDLGVYQLPVFLYTSDPQADWPH
jgi:hypothetical protein